LIKQVNALHSRIFDYTAVMGFAEDLVYHSIEKRSVILFYVNRDAWRFLPMAIKGKDWISIADTYLASKQKK